MSVSSLSILLTGATLVSGKCHNRAADPPCQSTEPQGPWYAVIWANGPGPVQTSAGVFTNYDIRWIMSCDRMGGWNDEPYKPDSDHGSEFKMNTYVSIKSSIPRFLREPPTPRRRRHAFCVLQCSLTEILNDRHNGTEECRGWCLTFLQKAARSSAEPSVLYHWSLIRSGIRL